MDKEIEEKCKAFLGKVENRLETVEKDVITKADKKVVDQIQTSMLANENKIKGLGASHLLPGGGAGYFQGGGGGSETFLVMYWGRGWK